MEALEREKKVRGDVEKAKRKLEGELKVSTPLRLYNEVYFCKPLSIILFTFILFLFL